MTTPQRVKHYGVVLAALMAMLCLLGTGLIPTAQASGPQAVTLTITQVLDPGPTMPSRQAFTYRLSSESPNAPMPSGSVDGNYEFALSGNMTIELGPLTFNSSGVYNYDLRGVTQAMEGYVLDYQVYSIRVTVSWDLKATVIVHDKAGYKVGELSFTQMYSPPPIPGGVVAVDPPVKKIVIGHPAHNDTFTFRLTAIDPTHPMPVGSTNGIKQIQIVGTGEKDFGSWEYLVPGTYRYMISEVNGGLSDYRYDTTAYTIVDVVVLDNGNLRYTRTINGLGATSFQSLDFVNTYTGAGIKAPTGGQVIGYDLPTAAGLGVLGIGCILALVILWRGSKSDA